MGKTKVLIVDDHPLFREGLRRLLDSEGDIECVAVAADGHEALRLAKEHQPDVALIDIAMPNMSGIEAARQIKIACPSISILMLSAFKYSHYVRSCIQAGVEGYLLKTTPRAELINAIQMVHSGEGVFNLEAAGRIIRDSGGYTKRAVSGGVCLNRREVEVLGLAANGLTNKRIASQLGISEKTVATHFVNIFRKLNAESRTEAVLHAVKDGYIDIDSISYEDRD